MKKVKSDGRNWFTLKTYPNALLWRPNSEMLHIEDAIGSTIAWPIDKIIRQKKKTLCDVL